MMYKERMTLELLVEHGRTVSFCTLSVSFEINHTYPQKRDVDGVKTT